MSSPNQQTYRNTNRPHTIQSWYQQGVTLYAIQPQSSTSITFMGQWQLEEILTVRPLQAVIFPADFNEETLHQKDHLINLTIYYVIFIICWCLKLKYIKFVAHLTCCVSKDAIFSHRKFCEVIVSPQEATNKITPCNKLHYKLSH